jgi:two-component system, OmpR family, sensor histidine kinase VicK
MTTLHMLTVRTNAALGRLASLQKRVDKTTTPAVPIVRTALKELTDSLEELQVASEQLQQQADESLASKQRLVQEQARLREFVESLPVACVWTTEDGQIEDANPAAADLLNVSAQHLAGRPLMLFTVERAKFSESLTALNEGLTNVVDLAAVLRPRERRPRQVRLVGRRLEHDARRCWFILETNGTSPLPPV